MARFSRHLHPLFKTWSNMMQRCSNENRKDYKWYGLRGISVCDRWKEFNNFVSDLSPTWCKGLWLDRINPNGNYEPDNCRWVSPSIQQINRRVRTSNSTNHKGVFFRKDTNKFRTGIMIKEKWKWLGTFESLEEAILVRKTAEREHY